MRIHLQNSSTLVLFLVCFCLCACTPKSKTETEGSNAQIQVNPEQVLNTENQPNDESTKPEKETNLEVETAANPENEVKAPDEPQSDAAMDEKGLILSQDLSELSEAQKNILSELLSDADPETLNAIKEENENLHFLWSDEQHPELFAKSIENLGGTYVGIGTDQSYVFIGWQKPSLAFAVDYDPWVIYIHLAYFAFFSSCDDSSCLDEAFSNAEVGKNLLNTYYANDPRLKDILEAYDFGQRGISRRLKTIRYTMNKLELKTFMNDTETFQYIKKLIQTGRLRTFQANLLADKAFSSIARVTSTLQAPITTLYLSNAEQYWAYSEQFKKNMQALTFTDNALIMRTAATKPTNADYRYSVQPASVFLAWLKSPLARSVRYITRAVPVKSPEDFPFYVDSALPPEQEESGTIRDRK